MKTLTFILIAAICLPSFAKQTPISYPSDKRIKRVAYSDNNVVPIDGTVFTTTQIEFSAEEYVLDVEGGDKEGWVVTYQNNLPNMLFIKPSSLDSHSNMTVVTNRHTYYFSVNSPHDLNDAHTPTYALKFVYPSDERKKLNQRLKFKKRQKTALFNAAKHPKAYNWDYAFHGDKSIMPAHVFDDGRFTYLELRPNQEVPAVFSIDNRQGEEALVNFNRRGHYLVIHRVSPQLTLRSGKYHVASIFNNRAIHTIKRG